ncbi:MAG: ABC transporter substrate-binding protein, partial [Acidobacteriota bacterium]
MNGGILNRSLPRALAAAALFLAACSPSRESSQTAAPAADIPVGFYGALSGGEAAFGTATLQGVKLAAEEINKSGGVLGQKIRLVV